jgi:hypothetical protein
MVEGGKIDIIQGRKKIIVTIFAFNFLPKTSID